MLKFRHGTNDRSRIRQEPNTIALSYGPAGGRLCAAGHRLAAEQQAQFEQYYRELVAWNERLNLTTITGYDDVQVKHFLDSLREPAHDRRRVGTALPLGKPLRLVDVGSGAGFPGIPLKIASPLLGRHVDGRHPEKGAFLGAGGGYAAAAGRFRSCTAGPRNWGAKANTATATTWSPPAAVAPLNVLVEYLLPLCGRAAWQSSTRDRGRRRNLWRRGRPSSCWRVTPCAWRRSRCRFWTRSALSCWSRSCGRPPHRTRAARGLARKKPL